jgi:histidinol-phosphatase
LSGWEAIDRLNAFLALTRRCWRTRAYGDFWSYMLVAEGAVDVAAEPALALHDMAALDVVVREAGGHFTGLDGVPGPFGTSAIASNGRLHEAAMAFVGHVPDGGESPGGSGGASNVRTLSSRRPSPE